MWYGPPVLGQAQRSRSRLAALVCVAGAVLVLPAIGIANALPRGHAQPAGPTIAAAESTGIALYSLSNRVTTATSRVTTLDERIRALREERAALKEQQRVARGGIAVMRARLAATARTLYEQGNVEPLEVFLDSKSLDDAMTSVDGLSRLGGQAHDMVEQLSAILARSRETDRALARREAALEEAARQARAAEAAAAAARAARLRYVAELAAQRAQAPAPVAESMPAAQPVAEPVTQAAPAPAPVAGGRSLTVSATAYSLPGYTASGLPVGWGIIAVDPRVIPLGTRVTVPGYGEAVAADTGTAIIGARIDIWFPTLAQAQAWGRQTITIVVH